MRGKDRAFATVPECAFPNIYIESVSASDTNFPWFHPVVITGKEDVDGNQTRKGFDWKALLTIIHETRVHSQHCVLRQRVTGEPV